MSKSKKSRNTTPEFLARRANLNDILASCKGGAHNTAAYSSKKQRCENKREERDAKMGVFRDY